MDETTVLLVCLGAIFSALFCVLIACAACCWLVWRACSKANGLDAADRVIAAQGDILRNLQALTEASFEIANRERESRANDQLLAVWLARNLVEAHSAGREGRPIETTQIAEPPDELFPGRDRSDNEIDDDIQEIVGADKI